MAQLIHGSGDVDRVTCRLHNRLVASGGENKAHFAVALGCPADGELTLVAVPSAALRRAPNRFGKRASDPRGGVVGHAPLGSRHAHILTVAKRAAGELTHTRLDVLGFHSDLVGVGPLEQRAHLLVQRRAVPLIAGLLEQVDEEGESDLKARSKVLGRSLDVLSVLSSRRPLALVIIPSSLIAPLLLLSSDAAGGDPLAARCGRGDVHSAALARLAVDVPLELIQVGLSVELNESIALAGPLAHLSPLHTRQLPEPCFQPPLVEGPKISAG
mmetsp:Transcript_38898/g.111161  ORF Transcript_38898/g.111161 Transcript_38898/m.111161 type:complete len:271 (-) Transcript_38898:136-948(-)